MHGGTRQGAGRKPGLAAKNAEEARRYLSQRVAEEIGPLADVLLEKALGGDMRALQMLLDRAWGKPRQEVQLVNKEPEQSAEQTERLQRLARILNGIPEEAKSF